VAEAFFAAKLGVLRRAAPGGLKGSTSVWLLWFRQAANTFAPLGGTVLQRAAFNKH
jgi:hypothetical protein